MIWDLLSLFAGIGLLFYAGWSARKSYDEIRRREVLGSLTLDEVQRIVEFVRAAREEER